MAVPIMKKNFPRLRQLAFLGTALLLSASALRAAEFTWTNLVNGGWSTAGNWIGGAPVSAADTVLRFTNSGAATYNATNNVANPFQLNQLIFDSTSSGLTRVVGNQLSFVNSGALLPLILQNGTGAVVISNAIVANTNLTFAGAGTGAMTVAGVISGANVNLVKNGAGVLTLTGNNTFGGTNRWVMVNGGTLSANNTARLGSLTNRVMISSNALLQLTATMTQIRAISLGTGGGRIEVTGASIVTQSGAFTNNANAFTKEGTGTLVLTAASTRTGRTTNNGGLLQLNNATALGNNATTRVVRVNGGIVAHNNITASAATYELAGGTLGVTLNGTADNDRRYSGRIDVLSDSTISIADARTPTNSVTTHLNALLTGSGSLNVTAGTLNSGNLFLTNNGNTYSGTLTINSNVNFIAAHTNGSTLGTATVVLNDGALLSLRAGVTNLGGTNVNTNFFYNNNIIVRGDSILDVRRPVNIAAVVNNTMILQGLAVSNATLTLMSVNGYIPRFIGPVTVEGAVNFNVSNNVAYLDGPMSQGLSAASLVKSGAGNLLLTNVGDRLYSGPTEVQDGILTVHATNGASLPLGINPNLTLSGGTLRTRVNNPSATNLVLGPGAGYSVTVTAPSTLQVGGIPGGQANLTHEFDALNLGAARFTMSASNGHILRFNGPATFGATASISNTGTLILNGPVTDGGAGYGLNKLGTGALVLSNLISRDFSGPVTLQQGTVRMNFVPGLTNALGSHPTIYINNGGTFELRTPSVSGVFERAPGVPYHFAATNENSLARIRVLRDAGAGTGLIVGVGDLTLANGVRFVATNANNYVLRVSGTTTLGRNVVFDNAAAPVAGAYAFELAGSITESAPGTRLTKSGFAQPMSYSGLSNPGFTGGTYNDAGLLAWRATNLAPGVYRFGTGAIHLDNGAGFAFQNNLTGGYTLENDLIIGGARAGNGRTNQGGVLDFARALNSPQVTNTGALRLRAPLVVNAGTAGSATPATFAGPVILESDNAELVINGSGAGNGRRVIVSGSVSGDSFGLTRSLTLVPNANTVISFNGDNRAFTGDFLIEQAYAGNSGRVRFDTTNALPGGKVRAAADTVSVLGFNLATAGAANVFNRFQFASNAILALEQNNTADLNLAALGQDVRLGAAENFTVSQTGLITPVNNTYKVGGGAGTITFASAGAFTNNGATPRRLDAHPNPYAPLSGGSAPGTVTINGSNSFTGGTVVHSGILGIGAGRANTPLGTGDVHVYGVLRASGGQGSFADAAGTGNNNLIVTHAGGEIRLDNAASPNTNRWGDTAPLALDGALLNFLGVNAAQRSFERVGDFSFAGGSRFTLAGSTNILGASALISTPNLIRVGAGTLQLARAAGAGEQRHNFGESNQFFVDAAVPLVNGMVAPYIVNATDNQFLTYGATGFSNAPATSTDLNTAGAADIVNAGATTLASDRTIHALRLNGNLSAGAGTVVEIGSGGLLYTTTATNTGVTLRFGAGGAGEGLVYVAGGATAVFNNNTLQAAGGVTKFGEGTLSLVTPNAGYGSGWNVNRGTLTLATGSGGGGLGAAAAGNFLNLNGGVTLNLAATNQGLTHTSGLVTSRDTNSITANFGATDRTQTFAPLGLRLETSGGGPLEAFLRVALSQQRAVLNVAGVTTLASDAAIAVQNVNIVSGSSNRLALAGGLAGTNRTFYKRGNGLLALPGNNSATFLGGRTHVEHGVLAVGHNGSLGNGASAATVAAGAVLQIEPTAVGYASTAPITFAPGSTERWTHARARFSDFTTPQTFTLPAGVNLQVTTNLTNFSDKILRLNGGSFEPYLHADDSRTNTTIIVDGINLELLADSKLGHNGVDTGRSGMTLDFRGDITEVGAPRSLTKVGTDTVILSGQNMFYSGGTRIEGGALRLGRSEVLPDGMPLHVSANGVLEMNNFDETIGRLTGAGRIVNSTNTENILSVEINEDSVYNGTFEGNLGVTRLGGGTFYLGGASTMTATYLAFDGATVVTASPDPNTGGSPLGATNTGTVFVTASARVLTGGAVEVARAVRVDGSFAGEKILGGATAHESTFSSPISLFGGVTLTATNGGRVNFTGEIVDVSGNNAVTKTGAGVVNLTRPNFWNGGTTVAAGTLLVNNATGSGTGGGNVTVNAGATLGGSGAIAGSVTLDPGASLLPGNSAGILRIDQNLSFAALASVTFEIGGLVQGAQHDHVSVGGNATFAGSIQLTLDPGYYPAAGNSFELVSFGSRSGTFDNAAHGARVTTTDNLGSFQINYGTTNVIASAFQYTDTDLDGIYDAWALKHFNLTSLVSGTGPTERFGDFDNDGLNNYGEFIAGMIPTNAASRHEIITAAVSGTKNFAVQFPTADETTFRAPVYKLQYTGDLTPPVVWTTVVAPVLDLSVPGVAQWIDDGSQTGGTAPLDLPGNRFYRVLVE
jgi:fibronectin-binding autotransporter adhesin